MGSPSAGTSVKLPRNTEVLLVVSPGEKELHVVADTWGPALGEKTCIILLNARIDDVADEALRASLQSTFDTVFHLKPVSALREDVFLYRTFGKGWTLAESSTGLLGGSTKILKTTEKRMEKKDWEDIITA